MTSTRRLGSPLLAGCLIAAVAFPRPAFAHNEAVHQRMTDYAYHVMLAMTRVSEGSPLSDRLGIPLRNIVAGDPSAQALYRAAAKAVEVLRKMKSGLPDDPAPCASAELALLIGGGPPDWQLPAGTSLKDLPMRKVRLPITVNYGNTPFCAIDKDWTPMVEFDTVNPGTFTTRDHTGVTLGYWAAGPDRELRDWVLRSTTLEALQNPVATAAVGAGTTVTVSAVCAFVCSFFPISCAVCPFVAVGAGGVVVDKINSIDAEAMESLDYVGLGHFIDMKPTPNPADFFDVKPGKFIERAGPAGAPDLTEKLVIAGFELGGFHVNHGESLAPKNYQIVLGSGATGTDHHPNTVTRSASQWEGPTVAHLPLTAVDNLGMFGYLEAKRMRGEANEAHRVGWPLHALGDASVPMHTVGASGYGHRPYEEIVDMVYESLMGTKSVALTVDTLTQAVTRALKWRKLIQDWRTLHASTEVPVRDLVTALAASTRGNAPGAAYKADASLVYLVDHDSAMAAYDNPAMAALQRDLLIEGIAAEIAFLVSYAEVRP